MEIRENTGLVEKTFTATTYFSTRHIKNFVAMTALFKSNPYFVVNFNGSERVVNAKSILGLLSVQIYEGDAVKVVIYVENKEDEIIANKEMNEILDFVSVMSNES